MTEESKHFGCHPRESGGSQSAKITMDPRFRGDDKGSTNKPSIPTLRFNRNTPMNHLIQNIIQEGYSIIKIHGQNSA